ncbi:MAG: zinc ABC transporter substrate-binding protein [Anaerolineales bacterium]|nr:zinc ABC transporter substrate-binding protein [Anaerolineales bacterium]
MKKKIEIIPFSILVIFIILLAACGGNAPAADSAAGDQQGKLKVVATTSIVGDVVANVAGDNVDLTVLLPIGSDPHSFDPSPQDIAAVADAAVVFANGAGLEAFMDHLLENAGGDAVSVHVSEQVDFLEFEGDEHEHEGEEHDHEGIDPHVWFDPNNVVVWVAAIESNLSELDPANAETYAANAQAYIAELEKLDTWIEDQIALIPAENRKLVTDHTVFGYFAARYGFEQVGAVVPGYSTLAQPSAQELAALADAIGEYDVKAVFVGNTVNPSLTEQVAQDTDVQLIFLYSGSLSDANGEAPTYLDLMRYDVNAIVAALK